MTDSRPDSKCAQAAYLKGQQRLEELREERDAAVRADLAAGETHRQIAEKLDISYGRINQIARGRSHPVKESTSGP